MIYLTLPLPPCKNKSMQIRGGVPCSFQLPTWLVTFVLVDDWYQRKGIYLLGRTVGSKPGFSDREMLTLMLAIDFFEFTSERRY